MLHLVNRFGITHIKYLVSKATNCKFQFGHSLDKDNLIQIFEHIYSRHPWWYKDLGRRKTSMCFFLTSISNEMSAR